MEKTKKKIERILNLEKNIAWAREHGDEESLTQYCIILTLERIEDRLDLIVFLLKQEIRDIATHKTKSRRNESDLPK